MYPNAFVDIYSKADLQGLVVHSQRLRLLLPLIPPPPAHLPATLMSTPNDFITESSKRRTWAVRVNVDTPFILDEMAEELGCLRIDGEGLLRGSTGVLLDKIAKGEFIIKKVGTIMTKSLSYCKHWTS